MRILMKYMLWLKKKKLYSKMFSFLVFDIFSKCGALNIFLLTFIYWIYDFYRYIPLIFQSLTTTFSKKRKKKWPHLLITTTFTFPVPSRRSLMNTSSPIFIATINMIGFLKNQAYNYWPWTPVAFHEHSWNTIHSLDTGSIWRCA